MTKEWQPTQTMVRFLARAAEDNYGVTNIPGRKWKAGLALIKHGLMTRMGDRHGIETGWGLMKITDAGRALLP